MWGKLLGVKVIDKEEVTLKRIIRSLKKTTKSHTNHFEISRSEAAMSRLLECLVILLNSLRSHVWPGA